jgi:hypothetical protein
VAELTFTSGAGWRQRGIFKVASLALSPEKGENLKPVANATAILNDASVRLPRAAPEGRTGSGVELLGGVDV